MTIKQFAQEHGISPQAVYQKLKKNGVSLAELKAVESKDDTGELSNEGVERLTILFKEAHNSTRIKKQFKEQTKAHEAETEQLNARIKELETENAQLKQQQASAMDRITSLTDQLTDAMRNAQRLAENAQQLELARLAAQQQTIKALPGGGVKGWFNKLFSKKGDGE